MFCVELLDLHGVGAGQKRKQPRNGRRSIYRNTQGNFVPSKRVRDKKIAAGICVERRKGCLVKPAKGKTRCDFCAGVHVKEELDRYIGRIIRDSGTNS